MKKIISMMLVFIFVFTLSACGNKNNSSDTATSEPTQSETFVAPENYTSVLLVTVNPQFKLYLDESNNVLAVEPVNSDAKTFSADIDFENKSLETVIGAILEKANEKGFVKENATVNFEIAEQKSESVNKVDILQKAVSAAKQKAEELKITITAEAKESADNTPDNTSSKEGTSTPSTSAPAKNTASASTSSSNKPATSKPSTTTPSGTNTSTECKHNIKYTFDNIANTWSHSGQCTLCKQSISKNVACEDKNKDNKCDACSAKMDFGTAYQNVGFCIFGLHLNNADFKYDKTPLLPAEIVFMETVTKTKWLELQENLFIYSEQEFEKTAKSLFNIDDSKISEMRKLQQGTRNVYDGTNNTYSWDDPCRGGAYDIEYIGYKKVSDKEYSVYVDDKCFDYIAVINCTYTDTVKISSIYTVDKVPSDLIKFK